MEDGGQAELVPRVAKAGTEVQETLMVLLVLRVLVEVQHWQEAPAAAVEVDAWRTDFFERLCSPTQLNSLHLTLYCIRPMELAFRAIYNSNE